MDGQDFDGKMFTNTMQIHNIMNEGQELSEEQKRKSKVDAEFYRQSGYIVMEDDVGLIILGKNCSI